MTGRVSIPLTLARDMILCNNLILSHQFYLSAPSLVSYQPRFQPTTAVKMAIKYLIVATESCWLLRGCSRSGSIVPAYGLMDDFFSVKQFLSAQIGGTVIPIANDKLPQKTPHLMHALGILMLSTDNVLRLALFSSKT